MRSPCCLANCRQPGNQNRIVCDLFCVPAVRQIWHDGSRLSCGFRARGRSVVFQSTSGLLVMQEFARDSSAFLLPASLAYDGENRLLAGDKTSSIAKLDELPCLEAEPSINCARGRVPTDAHSHSTSWTGQTMRKLQGVADQQSAGMIAAPRNFARARVNTRWALENSACARPTTRIGGAAFANRAISGMNQ